MAIDVIAHADAITALGGVSTSAELVAVLAIHGPIIATPLPGVAIDPSEIAKLVDAQSTALAGSLAYGLKDVLSRNVAAVTLAYQTVLEFVGGVAIEGAATKAQHDALVVRVTDLEGQIAYLTSLATQADVKATGNASNVLSNINDIANLTTRVVVLETP